MKQQKIYLDTSVISQLEAPDRLDWMADTRKLWDDIQARKFEAFISPMGILEIEDCPEPKRSALGKWLQAVILMSSGADFCIRYRLRKPYSGDCYITY